MLNLIAGVPDAQGNLNGQPNPNVLSEGDDILLIGSCDDCVGVTEPVTLTDAANNTRPATLERIQPSAFWRLHPQQPLASGQYTLKVHDSAPLNSNSTTEVMTYVFKVQGAPNTTPLAFEIGLASDLDRLEASSGTYFSCKESGPCGGHREVWTQWRPRLDIAATSTREATMPERQAFMYRLLPSDDPKAADLTSWNIVSTSVLELRVSSAEQKPEYCVELQALRITDLTIISVAKRCLNYTLPGPPFEPQVFDSLCTTDQPEEYARAWCTDNQAACSASNLRAPRACSDYPALCAVFLGNRAQDLVCR